MISQKIKAHRLNWTKIYNIYNHLPISPTTNTRTRLTRCAFINAPSTQSNILLYGYTHGDFYTTRHFPKHKKFMGQRGLNQLNQLPTVNTWNSYWPLSYNTSSYFFLTNLCFKLFKGPTSPSLWTFHQHSRGTTLQSTMARALITLHYRQSLLMNIIYYCSTIIVMAHQLRPSYTCLNKRYTPIQRPTVLIC